MGFSRWWEPCKEAECGRTAVVGERCEPCAIQHHRATRAKWDAARAVVRRTQRRARVTKDRVSVTLPTSAQKRNAFQNPHKRYSVRPQRKAAV